MDMPSRLLVAMDAIDKLKVAAPPFRICVCWAAIRAETDSSLRLNQRLLPGQSPFWRGVGFAAESPRQGRRLNRQDKAGGFPGHHSR